MSDDLTVMIGGVERTTAKPSLGLVYELVELSGRNKTRAYWAAIGLAVRLLQKRFPYQPSYSLAEYGLHVSNTLLAEKQDFGEAFIAGARILAWLNKDVFISELEVAEAEKKPEQKE